LVLLLAAGNSGGGEVGEDLAPARRAELEKKALDVNRQAVELYQAGRPGEAVGLLLQVLEMRQKLYPADKLPNGHPALAVSLNDLGAVLKALGQAEKALPYFQQALEMRQRLYPADKFPRGHPALALSLTNLAYVLHALGQAERALPYAQQALEMYRKLSPIDKFPKGHPELSLSLNNVGAILQALGQAERALPYFQEALEMNQHCYPADKFPSGHPGLATSLDRLGFVLLILGQAERALPFFQKALEMNQRLYPADKFPRGHPDLAAAFNNLGIVLEAMGQTERALPSYQQALEMNQRLYPADKFPQGHPELANSLHNLGIVLRLQGSADRALPHVQNSLEMYQRLYPAAKFPQGHPELATSLNSLAHTLKALDQAEQALAFYKQALEMRQRLYPADKFPDGHPELALSLNNLGAMLQAQGQADQALTHFEQALKMSISHLEGQALTAPEAQALELLAAVPPARDAYLTLARQLGHDPAQTYRPLWQSRAVLTRLLQARQQVTRSALADPKASEALKRLAQQLVTVRQRLAILPSQTLEPAQRDRLSRDLTEQKEDLQRQLARALPQQEALRRRARLQPADLAQQLPNGVVFLDFFRYFDSDKKNSGERYVAFVLGKGQPVRRIDLGEAGPVDSSIDAWLRDVRESRDRAAPARLRERLWGPLSAALPRGTHTLYLAPESNLARLPWAALPSAPGRVLLEDYRLAVVPHGPFLHEQLERLGQQQQPPWVDPKARVLAVGGVHDDLPASRREVEALQKQADPREVLLLDKTNAQPERVLKELPNVQYAHLATHGFFAEVLLSAEQSRLKKHRDKLRKGELTLEQGNQRVGLGLRSPLVYTGLVLAQDPDNPKASNQVTGETLVDLPLENLQLCVLSACETGLGQLTGGEGVQGLQRAFHLAGCPNVVASLWRVDDDATAALMTVFYDRLWHKNEPPIEALRQAQLTLYNHPERMATLARERGPKLKEAVDLPAGGKSDDKNPARARTKLWAAFVLSGVGR